MMDQSKTMVYRNGRFSDSVSALFALLGFCLFWYCLMGIFCVVEEVLFAPYADDDFETEMAVSIFALFLATFLAGLLAIKVFHRFAGKRVAYDGSWCLKCGYDLTGNVSGVCPECGMELPDTE